MVDVSIVNGIMNQLITGGHHPVHVWIVRPMVLSGPGRSGPAEILSGKFHGDDMPTCESVLTHHSEDQLASGYARVYIYILRLYNQRKLVDKTKRKHETCTNQHGDLT